MDASLMDVVRSPVLFELPALSFQRRSPSHHAPWARASVAARSLYRSILALAVISSAASGGSPTNCFEAPAPNASSTSDELSPEPPSSISDAHITRALHDGVRFLSRVQRSDGSWPDVESEGKTGTTSLVTMALLAAGEKPDSAGVRKALEYLRRFGPDQLQSTYAIALQTMVFADVEPEIDNVRIAANALWLERLKSGVAIPCRGRGRGPIRPGKAIGPVTTRTRITP